MILRCILYIRMRATPQQAVAALDLRLPHTFDWPSAKECERWDCERLLHRQSIYRPPSRENSLFVSTNHGRFPSPHLGRAGEDVSSRESGLACGCEYGLAAVRCVADGWRETISRVLYLKILPAFVIDCPTIIGVRHRLCTPAQREAREAVFLWSQGCRLECLRVRLRLIAVTRSCWDLKGVELWAGYEMELPGGLHPTVVLLTFLRCMFCQSMF